MAELAAAPALQQLKSELRAIVALEHVEGVLAWDQRTHMPPGGIAARAEQQATLGALVHARRTDPRLGDLLEQAQEAVNEIDPESDDACLVRVALRDFRQDARIPPAFVAEQQRTATLANGVWIEARAASDFGRFAPWLRKSVENSRQLAEYLGYEQHPMDALIAQSEPGFTAATVAHLFDELRPALVALAGRIAPVTDRVDDALLHRGFDEAAQERLAHVVAARFGYDFSRGRLDRTTHPFEIAFSRDDVRITTRYSPTYLSMSLMGTMHETGHALYEQGIAPALDGTPLGHGASPGMHESQSRLWENFVGRSRPFAGYLLPLLRQTFPGVLDDVGPEGLYRALNRVSPSPIRVEADEVTYCLHIMLRFDLEMRLLDGRVRPEDAAEAWNAAMQDYLGLTPPNDRLGVLQDTHWSRAMGGFQGYALGNIIAAQLWESILTAHPEVPEAAARGEFGTLLDWLRANVYQYGRKFDPADLIERATGSPLRIEPYVHYLQAKFAELYGL